MADKSIALVPGGNISRWPEVKLGRAYSHMMDWQSRVEEWESLRPIRAMPVQVGPSEAWVTIGSVVDPPFEALAAIFGDAIHNMRAALDAVTWEMANFDGHRPPTEWAARAVQFPLYDSLDKFDSWVTKTGSIVEPFRSRLEAEQPYKRAARLAAQGQIDTLAALHQIDITDKHRNSIRATATVATFDDMAIGIKGDLTKLRYEARTEVPLHAGAVLLVIRSNETFEVKEEDSGGIRAQFMIPYGGGYAPALDLLGTMAGKVRGTLDVLYGSHAASELGEVSVSIVDSQVVNVEHIPPTAV